MGYPGGYPGGLNVPNNLNIPQTPYNPGNGPYSPAYPGSPGYYPDQSYYQQYTTAPYNGYPQPLPYSNYGFNQPGYNGYNPAISQPGYPNTPTVPQNFNPNDSNSARCRIVNALGPEIARAAGINCTYP